MLNRRGEIFLVIGIFFFILICFVSAVPLSDSTSGNLSVGVGGNHAPVFGSLNSTIYICEGQNLYYRVDATDIDGDLLILSINPEDPFFLDPSVFSGQTSIVSYLYSGILTKGDAGGINGGSSLYIENISIFDGNESDSAIINITVIEKNNAPKITSPGVQTIWLQGEDTNFYHHMQVSDVEDGNQDSAGINFNISIVNSSGGVVNFFGINSSGEMNFTPVENQIGVYNVTVCANDTGIDYPHLNITHVCNQDGSSIFSCITFGLTVTNDNRVPNITSYFPTNRTFNAVSSDTLYFNISKNDADGTIPDAYWYVDNINAEYDAGSSMDEFIYSFGCGVFGEHTVKVDITDGLLNDSIQWNITLSDCASTPPGGGGGGGGGAVSVTDFLLDKDLLKILIKQGETKRETLNIRNIGLGLLNLSLDIGELKGLMILSQENLILRPGENKTINIDIFARENEIPDAYTGRIVVKDASSQRTDIVNVIIEVKEKKPLFDMLVDVLTETVKPGEEVSAKIKMVNMGDLRGIDILLYYAVQDFEGNILSFREESIAIDKELDVERSLKIPDDADFAAHVFYSRLSYENVTASATDVFMVSPKKTGYWLFIIILIIIILLIILAYYLIRKYARDRE